ncbi:MAG: GSCFA domain-containing protein [Vicingaceae bacterium]
MNFRTEIPPDTATFSIKHSDPCLFLGSCFTQNIGKKMQFAKFNVQINPLGIAFNPISLHHHFSLTPKKASELIVQEKQGIFFNTDFHSEFNTTHKEKYIQKVENQISKQIEQLKRCMTIFITYGTAWVYETVSDKQLVNNCHKLPAKDFTKRLLSTEEIIASFNSCIDYLQNTFNKEFNFVFTLSPVRHLKDGWHENQLSKATLLLAIESICSLHKKCSYFPAYEIVMDDLRDYRFYKEDMVHPNEQAIEYIWEKFKSTFFNAETLELIQEIEEAQRSFSHKAFHEKSEPHQQFLQQLLSKIQRLELAYQLNFQKEIKSLQNRLLG